MATVPLPVWGLALFLGELGWFLTHEAFLLPAWTGMLPVLAGSILAGLAIGSLSIEPHAPIHTLRFWRTLAVAMAAVAAAEFADLSHQLTENSWHPTAPGLVLYFGACVATLVALFLLAAEASNRGERVGLVLDTTTMGFAALLITWYVSLSDARTVPTMDQLVRTAFVSVLMAIAVLAMTTVVVSGGGAVTPWALRLFGLALGVELLGLLSGDPEVEFLTRSGMHVLLLASVGQQRRTALAPATPRRTSSDRRVTVLPYIAISAVDAVLLASLRGQSEAVIVMGSGAVVITLIIVIRQNIAFNENIHLIRRLALQERRFRSLVQNAADAIGIVSADGVATYASPGIERLTGISAQDWVGRRDSPVHPDDRHLVASHFFQVLAHPEEAVSYEVRMMHTDGGWRWIHVTHTNRLDDPAVNGIVVNLSDISEVRAYHDRLAYQASHDSLTGLANRLSFTERVEAAVGLRNDGHVGVALIDLDNFKAVNDTFGHHAGDALLIVVAERLRQGVRPQDLVARLGGDEFAVLFEGVEPAKVGMIARRALEILSDPVTVEGHDLEVAASIGYADAQAGDDAEQLLRKADTAMYDAKTAGKGQYMHYSSSPCPRAAIDLHPPHHDDHS